MRWRNIGICLWSCVRANFECLPKAVLPLMFARSAQFAQQTGDEGNNFSKMAFSSVPREGEGVSSPLSRRNIIIHFQK